ncbi:WhiB family transcriptional regulator [Microlunatus elymi]|uniref:Transcriptional regulator WhiB n=1 Tax=Microlunatus elymi TaxID=2596828 RepID=A0A516PZ78_9ACTN|nr:WhiB family transcriptional regulator [Microlunatus elymi]
MFDAVSNQSLATQLLAPVVGEIFDPMFAADDTPCRLVDPEVFFAEQPADVEYAKSLCRDCPVQDACLAGALQRHEPWGVWGGQLLVQGEVVARKRPRGRPRKHPLPEQTEVAPSVVRRWALEPQHKDRRVAVGAQQGPGRGSEDRPERAA